MTVPVEVVVPEVGEVGMEVTFVAWFRQDGDEVTAGEPLFQVDTQKTMFDVEALASGRLGGIRVGPGDPVEPRQVVAVLLGPGETLADVAEPDLPAADPPASDEAAADSSASAARPQGDASAPSTPPGSPTAAPSARGSRPAASPRAKALAAQLGIDLAEVEGTGAGGLIGEADVRRSAPPGAATPPSAGAAATASAGSEGATRTTKVRRAVADLTSRSWAEVPHFYVRLDADITAGLERAKPTALIVAALARALLDRPECHVGRGPDGEIVPRTSVDIGLLVDTPDGLLLPVVRDVDRLGGVELAEAIDAAAARARSGRLTADDFRQRSATVSNLGMFSVDEFAGIVAVPDPLLLSVGRATTRPRWDGSSWLPRSVATLTLSVDHRVLDGADAGRLATALESRLEQPDWMA